MKHSDIFGAAGLRELERLELKDVEKFLLAPHLKSDMLTDHASEIQQRIALQRRMNRQSFL